MTLDTWHRRYGRRAFKEGWSIFEANNGLEIQRDDEQAKFPSDRAAIRFVKRQAKQGARHAIEALAIVRA